MGYNTILKHFTHEFANGDVIRKYADLSYSVEEIKEHLDFPTPKEEIYKIAWTHLLSEKQILLERPDQEEFGRYEYVKDISPYGKVSYRKVKIPSEIRGDTFQERSSSLLILEEYLDNPDQIIYVEIPFGLLRYRDKGLYEEILNVLDKSDETYIESMFIERRLVYYRLNYRMEKILRKLINHNLYNGNCYVRIRE